MRFSRRFTLAAAVVGAFVVSSVALAVGRRGRDKYTTTDQQPVRAQGEVGRSTLDKGGSTR